MSMVIMNNVASINAQRRVNDAHQQVNKTLSKLSSGLRVVTAGDDAAGLAISEDIRADVASSEQSTRNAKDGISMLQIAEGALNEVNSRLIRLRELTMQSNNDTLGDEQRDMIQSEVDALVSEIERIGQSTDFNGVQLMGHAAGTMVDVEFQIGNGTEAADKFQVTMKTIMDLMDMGVSALNVGGSSVQADRENALTTIDRAIDWTVDFRGDLGAAMNSLETAISNIGISIENNMAAESRIRDADVARESSRMIKYQIIEQAGTATLSQANANPQMALSLLQSASNRNR